MLDKNKLADYVPGFQSRRTFSPQSPTPEELVQAQLAAEELAQQSGLTFTRFDQPDRLFESFKRGKGFFRFAHYYYVISAREDTPENRGKAGYFGQQLALYLTSLRLGCCWEFHRFDQEKLAELLFPDSEEKPLAVLLFGRVNPIRSLREGTIHQMRKLHSKSFDKMFRSDRLDIPYWFHLGLEYFHKAPGNANRYEEAIRLKDNTAYFTAQPGQEVSTGIGTLHFELAVNSLPSCHGEIRVLEDQKVCFVNTIGETDAQETQPAKEDTHGVA